MLGFMGKVLSNMLAMLMAMALLVGGCFYIGKAAVESAADANRRHQERLAAQPQPAAPVVSDVPAAPAIASPAPAAQALGNLVDFSEKTFANSVAADLIEQYNIVKDGDDEMAKSVRAGAVAEMYLQAKDKAAYEEWKERADAHMQRFLSR